MQICWWKTFHFFHFWCSHPKCSPMPLPHSSLSWILSKNIEHIFMCGVLPLELVLCLSLSTLILGISWNINLAQLVSSSVALPAQLVSMFCYRFGIFEGLTDWQTDGRMVWTDRQTDLGCIVPNLSFKNLSVKEQENKFLSEKVYVIKKIASPFDI